MPCLVMERWKAWASSASAPGRVRSRYSTTVTSAPRRRQTEPSSSPMTPAPMTIIDFGTAERASAPVESTIRAWSTSTPGRRDGSDPVAMTMLRASSTVSPPAPVTVTLPGPVMRPKPLIHSTLFFLNRNSMPLVRAPTLSPFCFCIWARSSSTAPLMPRLAKSLRASS